MSRDVFVQDLPTDARTVADIPDDWRPSPLPFDRDRVMEVVRDVVPTADFSDPTWGVIDLPGLDRLGARALDTDSDGGIFTGA